MDQDKLYEVIYDIMTNQQFGVLATIENSLPRTSIVAFTATNNLKSLFFLTAQKSRKFKNIANNPTVTMLIDNRPDSSRDVQGTFAVSVIGNAKQVDLKSANATKELFSFCHPALVDYLDNGSYALISMTIDRYEVTSGIDQVYTYKMGS